MSTFGIGKELSALQWRALVRQLVALKLLKVDYDRFNILRLTQACRDVLNGTRTLKLRKPSEKVPARKKAKKGATSSSAARESFADGSSNEIVFQALREWRKGHCRRSTAFPRTRVFHDATLAEIARVMPDSLDDLRGISGIGATKLARYGEPLLEVVKESASPSR